MLNVVGVNTTIEELHAGCDVLRFVPGMAERRIGRDRERARDHRNRHGDDAKRDDLGLGI